MARRGAAVHVVTTRRVYKGKLYQTHLLRRSYREGATVRNETLANLSHLPDPLVDLIRRGLRGEQLCSVQERFEVIASRHHGHVDAVLTTMRRLGVERLIASRPSRERDLVLAMVAARILTPTSKLATTRWWHTTTLAGDFWASTRRRRMTVRGDGLAAGAPGRIEKKLAARHLTEGGLVLYDLSSSYFEGRTCPLATRGHNRDGKKGQVAGQLRPAHRRGGAARWRCRSSRATRPIPTRCWRRCTRCARNSACARSRWSATAA